MFFGRWLCVVPVEFRGSPLFALRPPPRFCGGVRVDLIPVEHPDEETAELTIGQRCKSESPGGGQDDRTEEAVSKSAGSLRLQAAILGGRP